MLYGRVYGALPPNKFNPIEEVPIYAFYGEAPDNVNFDCMRLTVPFELLFTGEKGFFAFALNIGKYSLYAYVADKLVLLGKVNVTPGATIRVI